MSHSFRVILAIAGFLLLAGSGVMLGHYGYCKYRTLNPEPLPVTKNHYSMDPFGAGRSIQYTSMEPGVKQVHRDGAIVFDKLKWTYVGGCVFGMLFLLFAAKVKSNEEHSLEKQKAQQTPNDPLAD